MSSVPRMLLLSFFPAALGLASCGLVKAPFKVAGAVADGTAYVGKKAYDASAAPFKKTPEEKAAEAKEKKEKEALEAAAKAKQDPNKAKPTATATSSGGTTPPNPTAPANQGEVPPADFLPPALPTNDPVVPDDAPPPYPGQP